MSAAETVNPAEWEEEKRRILKAPTKDYKNHYTFNVAMPCGGCSNALDKRLGKYSDPEREKHDIFYEVNFDKKSVHVFADTESFKDVFAVVHKTKKKMRRAEWVDAEGNTIETIELDSDGQPLDQSLLA